MTKDSFVNLRHKMSLLKIEQKTYEQRNITKCVFFWPKNVYILGNSGHRKKSVCFEKQT